MVLVRLQKGAWHLITGSASEVLQELDDAGVNSESIANVSDDATAAVFKKGV